jgi:hypothetical protein
MKNGNFREIFVFKAFEVKNGVLRLEPDIFLLIYIYK